MVNSGSFSSEGDRNAKASFIQANSTAVSSQSPSPITASGAIPCKNDFTRTADSDLPSEVRAIEPTPTKTDFNSTMTVENYTAVLPNNKSSDAAVNNDKPTLFCSLPLDKVQSILSTIKPNAESEVKPKSTRKLLCLYCDRTFVNVNLRQKHVERCHSAKQFRRVSSRRHPNHLTSTPCVYCDKLTTTTEHTLKELFEHLIATHSNKYFGCLSCEDRFLNSSHLLDHNASIHKEVLTSQNRDDDDDDAKNEWKDIPFKVTRSKMRSSDVKPKKPPKKYDEAKKNSLKELRGKKLALKTTRMALKRSKRLQAKVEKKKKPKGTDKKDKHAKTDQIAGVGDKPDLISVNPYPEFDSFFRVKKITDHSIDNLKISSLTFDDVFDKAFFNRIRCNIQENLLHHIDGKLFKNEESESRISNFEKISNMPQEVQSSNSENYGCELSLNAVTPAASLLSSSQFGEDLESQIEYGSKPSKKKTQTRNDEVHYKYFTRRKYQASILEHKENRDLSKLDMWTQYVIKNRQQKILNSKKNAKEIFDYVSGAEYKNQMRREELNRILDRRGPFEDLREEVSKRAALDKLNSETEGSISEESFTEVRELLNEILDKVFEMTEDVSIEHQVSSATQKGVVAEIPSYLNLRRTSSLSSEGEIDKSDKIALICSSQETENFELPTNSVRGKDEKVELTGEWARSRIFVCAACGLKLPNMKQLLEHKSAYHQYVWVQHYELVGNQSELYRHLSIPGLGKVGGLEDNTQCKLWRRSEARLCTKCGKQCNSLGELHRHILECGGDWTWMLARKKCKYRPFGAKSRRKRRGLVKRMYTQKTEPSEKKIYKKAFDGPRPKPSDADSIERMLANLPPKRATRKIMSLKDGFHTARNNQQMKATNKQAKMKCSKLIHRKLSDKDNQNSYKPNNGFRKSLRSLNKVLASRILDTNSALLVKRRFKNLNTDRITRQSKASVEEEYTDLEPEDTTEPLVKKKTIGKSEKSVSCDIQEVEEVKSKRTSPRIDKSTEFTKAAVGKMNIKRFFPVRKKNNSSQFSEGVIDSQKTNFKRKSPEPEPSEAIQQETKTALPDVVKKPKKETFSNLVRTLSLRRKKISKKPPASNPDKEKEKEEESLNRKRKLRSSFRKVVKKIKQLKATIPILEKQTDDGATTSKPNDFLEETTSKNEEPPELEKIVITAPERDANVADPPIAAPIVVNCLSDKGPSLVGTIFDLQTNNERTLQAKGELNFDTNIEINTNIDTSAKMPALISPKSKGKIRKPARGLNDCIAMLTSKLNKSLDDSSTVNSIFNLIPSDSSERTPLDNETDKKGNCILKVPSFSEHFKTKPKTATSPTLEIFNQNEHLVGDKGDYEDNIEPGKERKAETPFDQESEDNTKIPQVTQTFHLPSPELEKIESFVEVERLRKEVVTRLDTAFVQIPDNIVPTKRKTVAKRKVGQNRKSTKTRAKKILNEQVIIDDTNRIADLEIGKMEGQEDKIQSEENRTSMKKRGKNILNEKVVVNDAVDQILGELGGIEDNIRFDSIPDLSKKSGKRILAEQIVCNVTDETVVEKNIELGGNARLEHSNPSQNEENLILNQQLIIGSKETVASKIIELRGEEDNICSEKNRNFATNIETNVLEKQVFNNVKNQVLAPIVSELVGSEDDKILDEQIIINIVDGAVEPDNRELRGTEGNICIEENLNLSEKRRKKVLEQVSDNISSHDATMIELGETKNKTRNLSKKRRNKILNQQVNVDDNTTVSSNIELKLRENVPLADTKLFVETHLDTLLETREILSKLVSEDSSKMTYTEDEPFLLENKPLFSNTKASEVIDSDDEIPLSALLKDKEPSNEESSTDPTCAQNLMFAKIVTEIPEIITVEETKEDRSLCRNSPKGDRVGKEKRKRKIGKKRSVIVSDPTEETTTNDASNSEELSSVMTSKVEEEFNMEKLIEMEIEHTKKRLKGRSKKRNKVRESLHSNSIGVPNGVVCTPEENFTADQNITDSFVEKIPGSDAANKPTSTELTENLKLNITEIVFNEQLLLNSGTKEKKRSSKKSQPFLVVSDHVEESRGSVEISDVSQYSLLSDNDLTSESSNNQKVRKKTKEVTLDDSVGENNGPELSCEIKENNYDQQNDQESTGRRRSIRSAKIKALENILGDALAELTDSERNREVVKDIDINVDVSVDRNKIKERNTSSIGFGEEEAQVVEDETIPLQIFPETSNEALVTYDLVEPLKEVADIDRNSEQNSNNAQELRRSRRNSKRVTYTEDELAANVFEIIDRADNDINVALEESVTPFKKMKDDKKDKKLSSDELFDLLKATPAENIELVKPTSSFLNNFDEISDDFNDDNFDVFENILEKSIAVIEENLAEKSPSILELLEPDADNKLSETCEERIQNLIEAEKIGVGIKPKKSKSKRSKKHKSKLLGEEIGNKLENLDEKYTSDGIVEEEPSSTAEVESCTSLPPNFEKVKCSGKSRSKTRGKHDDKIIFCDICNKTFCRTDNLVKHKRTLTHISKLSEIEAKEAEMKAKLVQNEETRVSDVIEITSDSSKTDINLFDMLHNVDRADDPTSKQPPSPFSMNMDNSRLKLADIINDVLNKPVLSRDEDKHNFSDIIMQNSSDVQTTFRRYRSLGERKSFDSDSQQVAAPPADAGTKSIDYFEPQISKAAGTILEKQISLLQNIIENRSELAYIDDISFSSGQSTNENNSVEIESSKQEDSNIYSEKGATENLNDSNFLKPPTQYEEISEDSTNLRNYDEQKSRKVLNRDEELFLECCSLLKSGSEVSNYSKKSSKVLNNLELKPSEEPDWLESKSLSNQENFRNIEDYSNSSRIPTPLGDNFVCDDSNSNTISSDWNLNENDGAAEQKTEGNDSQNRSFVFEEVLDEESKPATKGNLSKFGGIISKAIKNQFNNLAHKVKSRSKTPSEESFGANTDSQEPKKPDELSDGSSDNKKLLTKGAMKVFEGLKVSIPTEDLNMTKVFNRYLQNPKPDDILDTSKLPKTTKITKSQSANKFIFNIKKKPAAKRKKLNENSANSQSNDVYDFEETQDNSDVFAKPDFRSFRNMKSEETKKSGTQADSDNDSEECINSALSSSVGSFSDLPNKKAKTQKNITKKKCMIMGRIFKNAVKSRADDDIRDIPIVDNVELVENFVLNCPKQDEPPTKPPVMTEEELNLAFDKLVGGQCGEDKPVEIIKEPLPPSNGKLENKNRKKAKIKTKKRTRTNSDSTDDEFSLSKTTKKRTYRKNSKVEDNSINLEQELKECIGVASRKSQRKCTSGKQNILVEYWSSDESMFEALLESQIIESKTNGDIVNEAEKIIETIPEIEPEQPVQIVEIPIETKHREKPRKTDKKPQKLKCNTSTEEKTTEVSSAEATLNRRKRAAANPLYHWSSSSEDESCDLIEVKPIRDEVEDDEDRPIQHGWIVGDSPKKLVTMLAQAKGKKCEGDGVKEQGKKRTNSYS